MALFDGLAPIDCIRKAIPKGGSSQLDFQVTALEVSAAASQSLLGGVFELLWFLNNGTAGCLAVKRSFRKENPTQCHFVASLILKRHRPTMIRKIRWILLQKVFKHDSNKMSNVRCSASIFPHHHNKYSPLIEHNNMRSMTWVPIGMVCYKVEKERLDMGGKTTYNVFPGDA